MKEMYLNKINELLENCEDLNLLDLIWKILSKSVTTKGGE